MSSMEQPTMPIPEQPKPEALNPDRVGDEVAKEKIRIYENPALDPTVREVEANITKITNQDVVQIQRGEWGEGKAKEANGQGYASVWQRTANRVSVQQWDIFLRTYPEKAAAYRSKDGDIEAAFVRQE